MSSLFRFPKARHLISAVAIALSMQPLVQAAEPTPAEVHLD
jgi:sulfonate transport system substrate-binding protein